MSTAPIPLDPSYLDPATQDSSTIPAFIRQGVDTDKVQQTYAPKSEEGAPDMAGQETVAEATPGKISVYDPSKYTRQARDHEMTHEFQDTRSDGTIPVGGGYELPVFGQHPTAAPEQYPVGDLRNYSYGGEDALLDAQADGKSVGDFNVEQQADMVADYKAKQDAYLAKAAAGTLTPADENAMDKSYRAYHPIVQQLASQPKSFRESLPSVKTVIGIGKPDPLAPAPAPPGLPYGVAGVTPVDPLLGEKRPAAPTPRPIPPQFSVTRKMVTRLAPLGKGNR